MKTLAFSIFSVSFLQTASAVSLIQLNFAGPVTPAQQQVFEDAADFWNSAITGYDLLYNNVGVEEAHSLTINVTLPEIDGVGQVLGSAGPNTVKYYDDNPLGAPTVAMWYTLSGSMQFDSADVDAMIANNSFYGVVLHEMAHVIGIGTLWEFNTVNGYGVNLYTSGSGQYLGANALAAWQTEFGQAGATYVPVELGGGTGTANGHWNEVDFQAGLTGITSSITNMDFAYELMTGWTNGTFFLSEVTLGGLDDLGYIVDYSKAGVIEYVPEPALSSMLGLAACALLCRRR
ncbi:MAG: peptidase [Verrucomicrobiae bacterium]|nr:peptidase [Verrucomicrobiae bacterium]